MGQEGPLTQLCTLFSSPNFSDLKTLPGSSLNCSCCLSPTQPSCHLGIGWLQYSGLRGYRTSNF